MRAEARSSVVWLLCLMSLAKVSSTLCSPPLHHNWTRLEKMDPNGILQMQWHLRDKEIVFRVTVNSRGFIAIGFLYQKFTGFDMALAWIHDRTGKANILVSFLFLIRKTKREKERETMYRVYTTKHLRYLYRKITEASEREKDRNE